MPIEVRIPLNDQRVSPKMEQFIRQKGFGLQELNGKLFVIGEENGEQFELFYALFCQIAQTFYIDELPKEV